MASRKSQSAGLLLFRGDAAHLEVLLGHPGGPFWQTKDDGAWSILKGLIGADEEPLSAARREFAEETGYDPDGDFLPLGEARQPGGKVVHPSCRAWKKPNIRFISSMPVMASKASSPSYSPEGA